MEVKKTTIQNTECLEVIKKSYETVAKNYNLTKDNDPYNPAFMTESDYTEFGKKYIDMFAVYEDGRCIGFFDVLFGEDKKSLLDLICVLPEFRNRGLGKQMLDYALNYAEFNGRQTIAVRLNEDIEVSKKWLADSGFEVLHTKKDDNSPFAICTMVKNLNPKVIEARDDLPVTYKVGSDLPEEKVFDLYNDNGWTLYSREMDSLMRALKKSSYVLSAWVGDQLVGLIRTVGDGEHILYVQDILVLESYHRRGIGSELMKRTLESQKHIRQKTLLTGTSEKQRKFYESLGFQATTDTETVAFVRHDM